MPGLHHDRVHPPADPRARPRQWRPPQPQQQQHHQQQAGRGQRRHPGDEPDIFPVLSSNLTDYLPQVIKIMSISTGDKSVDLPSLNIEHNYPHLLSELVMKL